MTEYVERCLAGRVWQSHVTIGYASRKCSSLVRLTDTIFGPITDCRSLNGIVIVGPTLHYSDVIMGAIASQITSPTTQSFFQTQIKENIKTLRHWLLSPVNSPHKRPVTRKMFPFDDVIMCLQVLVREKCLSHVWQFCIVWRTFHLRGPFAICR